KVIDKYIPDEEVKNIFLDASIVVLPYRDATQSGVVGIAYAFARPVVATNVGGISELVVDGETGFLSKSNTNEEIAELIVKLFKDRNLYKNMCLNAYYFYRTKFSWDSIAKKVLQINKQILYRGEK
ncbi:MAG: glycosyltransferase family 4 protein, partial [Endomicrobia bacterium]|nr:glycosyltransferase family 4 protein [Endomicrobiia bacterium]